MSKPQRIESILAGLLLFLGGVIMIMLPDAGYTLILVVISLYLLLYSIRTLAYYFTMARYMVEGRMVLYKGIIALDLGIFIGALQNVPRAYIMIYLLLVNLFAAIISMMRAMDERKLGAGRWKLDLVFAVIELLISIDYIFVGGDADMLVILFASSLLAAGLHRIAEAFRNTAIVYIP